jgi:predicted RNase H-like HicB family nuclease
MRTYSVLLAWDEDVGGYNVSVPALPGCYTQGDTVEEALDHAREAITGFLKVLAMDGEEIPVETRPAVVHQVEIPAEVAAPAS